MVFIFYKLENSNKNVVLKILSVYFWNKNQVFLFISL